MARATVEREPIKPIIPPITSVTLFLNPGEAQTLANILALVAGTGLPRRQNDAILRALEEVGVSAQHNLRTALGWEGGITVPYI